MISIEENTKEKTNHAVEIATGTELLASCHRTNSDSGSVLIKNTGERMRTLKPSLDASGNKMRTRKLIDVTDVEIRYGVTSENLN